MECTSKLNIIDNHFFGRLRRGTSCQRQASQQREQASQQACIPVTLHHPSSHFITIHHHLSPLITLHHFSIT
jgi:hypothetical protein